MDNSKKGYTGFRPDIISALPNREFSSVLDIGCGEGQLGAQIKRLLPLAKVSGIDGDPQLLAKADKNLDQCWYADLDSTDWLAACQGQKFDLIIFADVLEHLRSPNEVLQQALALLDEGGIVVSCIPNIRHWSTFFSLGIKGTWPSNERGIFDKTHLRFFTRKNILNLLSEAGLKVLKEKRNVRIVEAWSWTNIPGKLFDWWPFRPFFTFQYIHVCGLRPTNE